MKKPIARLQLQKGTHKREEPQMLQICKINGNTCMYFQYLLRFSEYCMVHCPWEPCCVKNPIARPGAHRPPALTPARPPALAPARPPTTFDRRRPPPPTAADRRRPPGRPPGRSPDTPQDDFRGSSSFFQMIKVFFQIVKTVF